MLKGSCVILQSGGPTCVINSSLAGLIKEVKKHQDVILSIYGSLFGIDGMINDNLIDLNAEDDKQIERLYLTPGAILGTTRHILSSNFDDVEYHKIKQTLQKYNIRYFFIIGGNDSMDTASKMSKYLQKEKYDCIVLGIPKTIDNDLDIIDHAPGYGSAIKYISNTLSEIEYDTSSYDRGRVTIVEIMGRDAGWLTAGSKLASLKYHGPDLIYLPEVSFDMDKFLKDVIKIYQKKKKVLVAVSEGIVDSEGKYILNSYKYLNTNDVFGHQQLGGVGSVLANIVKEKLDYPVRSIELNLMQRCSALLASKQDVLEACNLGKYAVEMALIGTSGCLVGYNSQGNLFTVELDRVANAVKKFPISWIINGNNISKEYIKYAKPLIKGKNCYKETDGIARFAKFKKISVK